MRILPALIFFLALAPTLNAGAAGELRSGNRAYNAGKYGAAFDVYRSVPTREGAYNAAAALYKLQDYQGALEAYDSVADSGGELAQKAFFNAGNAAYMAGDSAGAIERFKQAVLMDLSDKRAVHNLQFVLKEKQDGEKDRQQDTEGENNSQDNSPENSQDPRQNPPGPGEQPLSKEEADNILQQAAAAQNQRSAQMQPSGGEPPKPDKDW